MCGNSYVGERKCFPCHRRRDTASKPGFLPVTSCCCWNPFLAIKSKAPSFSRERRRVVRPREHYRITQRCAATATHDRRTAVHIPCWAQGRGFRHEKCVKFFTLAGLLVSVRNMLQLPRPRPLGPLFGAFPLHPLLLFVCCCS